MFKAHYTRLILWLIRPALEQHLAERDIEQHIKTLHSNARRHEQLQDVEAFLAKREREQSRVADAIVDDIRGSGRAASALERAYGLQRTGR